jgi:hypothetical protein
MPDVVHTIAARIRRLVGNRRHVVRHRTSLPLSLSLIDERDARVENQLALRGVTQEISESGLTFVVPAGDFGSTSPYLTGRPFQIVLKLPVRLVEMHVVTVHYEKLQREGYLIGARITRMSDDDRTRYMAYMRRLSMKAEARGM